MGDLCEGRTEEKEALSTGEAWRDFTSRERGYAILVLCSTLALPHPNPSITGQRRSEFFYPTSNGPGMSRMRHVAVLRSHASHGRSAMGVRATLPTSRCRCWEEAVEGVDCLAQWVASWMVADVELSDHGLVTGQSKFSAAHLIRLDALINKAPPSRGRHTRSHRAILSGSVPLSQ